MGYYWCLVLENFEGEDDVYYFANYEIAKKNFDNIVRQHREMDEFRKTTETACEWFDSNYNEYSTFVTLIQMPLPEIYDEVIF